MGANRFEADNDGVAEFQASLIAIAAAAFSVDGIYAEVKTLPGVSKRVNTSGVGTARWRNVARTILQGLNIAPVDRTFLRSELKWLYDVRDRCVHHGEKPRPSQRHPRRSAHVSVEVATYGAQNARRAVDTVFELLDACQRSKHGADWATSHLARTEEFRQRR